MTTASQRLPPDLATLAIHGGQKPDPSTGAIMPPIYQTSTYVQSAPGQHQGYVYARGRNPTRDCLEANVAALEGASYGLAFASGCAAMTTVLLLLEPGSHILVAEDVYGGTYRLLERVFRQRHLHIHYCNATAMAEQAKQMGSQLTAVWVETPSNPLLQLVDLEQVRQAAPTALMICDNTFASPILQRPLAFGCDIVLHSTTKYINGHSDVIGGFLATNQAEWAERLRFLQNSIGSVPGPMDAWLVLRGCKTLPLRMKAHCAAAQELAERCSKHRAINKVHYPGLPQHPQHSLARRQMAGFGGMISLELAGGLAQAKAMLQRCQLFALAESLGGVESLIEHPGIMTHASIPQAERLRRGISDGLIRLSVGLEHIEDLWLDLQQALESSVGS